MNLQLLFIADLKHKYIREDQKKCKPGRQIVTFLILSNFGLWITYNFEIQKVREGENLEEKTKLSKVLRYLSYIYILSW